MHAIFEQIVSTTFNLPSTGSSFDGINRPRKHTKFDRTPANTKTTKIAVRTERSVFEIKEKADWPSHINQVSHGHLYE